MRTILPAAFLLPVMIGQSGSVQEQVNPSDGVTGGCWQAAVHLSVVQTKARLRHTTPVSSPLLYSSLRITNAILSFRVATDQDGNVVCIQAVSGHPLIIGVAIEAIHKWKFRAALVNGQRQSMIGTLVLAVAGTEHGLKTRVLSAEPTTAR